MAKETYQYGKRDLLMGKRALSIWQKSPINMAKEPYQYGKREPTNGEKRPIHTHADLRYAHVNRPLFPYE